MSFSHPLARAARIWPAHLDERRYLLVVVTTLELDPHHKNFKKKMVDQLSGAVHEYVKSSDNVDGYCLINRMRDWFK